MRSQEEILPILATALLTLLTLVLIHAILPEFLTSLTTYIPFIHTHPCPQTLTQPRIQNTPLHPPLQIQPKTII